MRRAFLLGLGLALTTWLEFEIFPGHTYLASDTQLYLPMLERLDTPGFLSRDLVAIYPTVTYTIYDEVTLFLHETAKLTFKSALLGQEFLFRLAGIIGIFLFARAAGLGDLLSLLSAALVNLGAVLSGPAIRFIALDPVPSGFAIGLILLSIGLFARSKPALASLAAGIALLYSVPISFPLWCAIVLAFVFDRRLRKLLRPSLTMLLIVALLMGNLVQLQPGVIEPQALFDTVSPGWAKIMYSRTPYVWISSWAGRGIWQYVAILVCGFWATARIWSALNRQMKWFVLTLPILGILSIPFSYLGLERFRWILIPQWQPAQSLIFTVAMASVCAAIAAARAVTQKKRVEAFLWFSFVLALPLHSVMKPALKPDNSSVREIAEWAENHTWGASLFLFPDAGKSAYPGVFRALSRRGLWVDWKSGEQVDYFKSFAVEWEQRWRQSMDGPLTAARLKNLLELPIDYYVLNQQNRLTKVQPVFQNNQFAIYSARDLRNVFTPEHPLY